MLRSQPLIDDRRRGPEERPRSFFAPIDALVSGVRPPEDEVVTELDLDILVKQLEIACHHCAAIERIAVSHDVLPSIIAGFCSRRSGWGLDLTPVGADGTRDFKARPVVEGKRRSPLPPDGLGYKRGLMALDYDRHPLARESLWRDPVGNLDAAFALVADHRVALRRRTTLQGEGLLRASLTAFESGLEKIEHTIRLGLDVDRATPGWRYEAAGCGRDVLARAAFFQAEGWD